MTRQEYMQQLAALLAAMPEAERRDALDYYEEYFDAAGPEKEAQTVALQKNKKQIENRTEK